MLDRKWIRQRRQQLGMTQREAALKVGWRKAVVWTKLESGANSNPRLDTLEKIARVLKCRVSQLIAKGAK